MRALVLDWTSDHRVDAFLVSSIVVSFALLVTTHVALAAGLVGRKPRSRGLLALVLPPLAPYFGLREKMWVRSVVWMVSLAVYVVARTFAR